MAFVRACQLSSVCMWVKSIHISKREAPILLGKWNGTSMLIKERFSRFVSLRRSMLLLIGD